MKRYLVPHHKTNKAYLITNLHKCDFIHYDDFSVFNGELYSVRIKIDIEDYTFIPTYCNKLVSIDVNHPFIEISNIPECATDDLSNWNFTNPIPDQLVNFILRFREIMITKLTNMVTQIKNYKPSTSNHYENYYVVSGNGFYALTNGDDEILFNRDSFQYKELTFLGEYFPYIKMKNGRTYAHITWLFKIDISKFIDPFWEDILRNFRYGNKQVNIKNIYLTLVHIRDAILITLEI